MSTFQERLKRNKELYQRGVAKGLLNGPMPTEQEVAAEEAQCSATGVDPERVLQIMEKLIGG